MATLDKRKLEQLIRNQPGMIDDLLRETAIELVSDVQFSFGSSPPGRTHQRGKRTHVASRAGFPPNVDTGRLRASITWRRRRAGEYEVSDGTEYGYGLEVGTSGVAARPFMRPAFERARNAFEKRLREKLR